MKVFLFLFIAWEVSLLQAATVKLPIIADSSICCYENDKDKSKSERDWNQGGSDRIRLKGIENIILLNFDARPLREHRVNRATLWIKPTESNHMIRKVGISTIAAEWDEGGGRDSKAKPGESCYLSPSFGSGRNWGGPGSVFLDAVGGRGGTIWTQSLVRETNGWLVVDFDGRLLEACAAELSKGLAIYDDNGQVKSIDKEKMGSYNGSNNSIWSREAKQDQVWLEADVVPIGKTMIRELPVQVGPWIRGANDKTGGMEVIWPGPETEHDRNEILGYRLAMSTGDEDILDVPRWMLPTIPPPGQRVRAFIPGLKPVGDARVNVSVIGRGGALRSFGRGTGKVSQTAPVTLPLVPAPIKLSAKNSPPPVSGGIHVWAVPDCVRVNPITGNVQDEKDVKYDGEPAGNYRKSNAVWDASASTVGLHGLRGEWVAYQLIFENSNSKSVKFQVIPDALTGPDPVGIPSKAIRLSRLWYIKPPKAGEKGWYADPLLPVKEGETIGLPDPVNAVPGQKNQAVYVEFFIPRDLKPGEYVGKVEVRGEGIPPLPIQVRLQVSGAVMPAEAHFVFSMNNYASPGKFCGIGNSRSLEFLATEREYYAMAHEHRTTLAVLHYYQNGQVEEGCAPPLGVKDGGLKVTDWLEWDNRFGPFFDGSAFQGTQRDGVPLDHFYLPFHENWPVSMAEYRWNDLKWEDHWRLAGPIGEGFDVKYQQKWKSVLKDFQTHLVSKKWKTQFHVYLNNKYKYKKYDAKPGTGGKQAGYGTGSSFWLLDEPQHMDDYLAIAFFGKMVREVQQGSRHPLQHRGDISRPQWGRDSIDGLIDLYDCSGYREFLPWLQDWRERYDMTLWSYGGTPDLDRSPWIIVMRSLDLYQKGIQGFVPWKTNGGEESWRNFESTAVFYPGKPMGLEGPCASLRLKAYRRGEQDVEYLWLLGKKRGFADHDPDRRLTRQMMGDAVKVKHSQELLDEYGGKDDIYVGVQPEQFEALRREIARELGEKR